MVSEEMYEFPQEAVEIDGTFDSDVNPAVSESRYVARSRSHPERSSQWEESLSGRDLPPAHHRHVMNRTSGSSNPVELVEVGFTM